MTSSSAAAARSKTSSIVDNIEVPNINNFANFASAGGTASIVDPILIEDVTFLTGGYPAPFINRASSVLQIAQREGKRDGFGSRLTLGFPGVGTVLEGGINEGKGSWLVSARRSFVDVFTEDTGIGGGPPLSIVSPARSSTTSHQKTDSGPLASRALMTSALVSPKTLTPKRASAHSTSTTRDGAMPLV